MNDTSILVELIKQLPATVAAVGSVLALIVSLRSSRKVDEVKKTADEVKVATDGMKSALVKVTRSDALQEGHTAGVKEEKAAAAKAKGK